MLIAHLKICKPYIVRQKNFSTQISKKFFMQKKSKDAKSRRDSNASDKFEFA